MRLEVGLTISSSSNILHCLKYANHDVMYAKTSSYKVHMNTTSNGELSDPLCDSVNRGLTLVRLVKVQLSTSLDRKETVDGLEPGPRHYDGLYD